MKRTLIVAPSNLLKLNIATGSENRTWYFVNWNSGEKDENGCYTIYTYKSTYGESIPVFKSKDWDVICNVGNLINGMFHRYFEISNSYPIVPPLNLDDCFTPSSKRPSPWEKIKSIFSYK